MPARTNAKSRTAQQPPKLAAVPNPEPSETPAAAPGSEEAPKPELTPVPSETPKQALTPALKPQPKPLASVDLGARQVTYYFPTATLSDSTIVKCVHQKYGHESEAAAKRCITALVAQKGHKAG